MLLSTTAARAADPTHGIAMHGAPALSADFTSFPYVNAEAPKGGRLSLGALGTFDSLNPHIVRGVTPPYLREFVYESLLARSNAEPFALYPWVAQRIEVPQDRSAITVHIDPRARFSDGTPITADDILFSHALLKEKGWPYHRGHYGKVERAEKLGPLTARFTFAPLKDVDGRESIDREMPLILGLMPVLPRHKITPESFEQTSLEPPVGSGPYRVTQVDAGRALTYTRNPDWWARDLPIARGRFNFDQIRLEMFRDVSALFEAFKSGEIDIRPEDDPTRWIGGYGFQAVTEGRVLKREFKTELPSGMTALVMNARTPLFADARVRRAFILMFDAEWINRALFNGAFKRTTSFFDRSRRASTGTPADARERALLAPFPGAVRPEILDGTWTPPRTSGTGEDRASLQAAFRLLQEAGYSQKSGRLVDKDGRPVSVEFLAANRQQERVMLAYLRTLDRLGITASVRQVDSAQYFARLNSREYDIIQWNWSASLSPGNEQMNRWSSRAADIPGSLNYAGVRSPAVDAMIDAMLHATTPEDFASAVRALDRVLLSGDHVIPLFHLPAVWIAHWDHIRPPDRLPLSGYDLDTWWSLKR